MEGRARQASEIHCLTGFDERSPLEMLKEHHAKRDSKNDNGVGPSNIDKREPADCQLVNKRHDVFVHAVFPKGPSGAFQHTSASAMSTTSVFLVVVVFSLSRGRMRRFLSASVLLARLRAPVLDSVSREASNDFVGILHDSAEAIFLGVHGLSQRPSGRGFWSSGMTLQIQSFLRSSAARSSAADSGCAGGSQHQSAGDEPQFRSYHTINNPSVGTCSSTESVCFVSISVLIFFL
ncbi:hypothetical protein [Paraburkholderia nemoris]|uniref:hypothetical protein n=1 Tax=Paraburkholderia nemoris TaxID=2793076 RepID=UPI001B8D624A|nr:hypothetical protein [Paraburkholderia nemoris]